MVLTTLTSSKGTNLCVRVCSYWFSVVPEKVDQISEDMRRFNLGEDCPVFEGMWPYCQIYTGASIESAQHLNNGQSDIAINWSGGLHHAR